MDRIGNRALERAHPPLRRLSRRLGPPARRLAAAMARGAGWARRRLLAPAGARFFRALELGDRALRRTGARAARAATRASAVVTRERALAGATVVCAAVLIASQFVAYSAVEVGQSGYAGLPDVAAPPTVESRSAGSAHAYLLIPIGLAAALLGLAAARRGDRRLGLAVSGLGAVAVAVVLAVDLPAGLDVGPEASRFADADAVLQDGFYAELAAAAGLVLCGLLYYARPCRIRINLSGRAASGRRRRPRRRASSPAKVARSA